MEQSRLTKKQEKVFGPRPVEKYGPDAALYEAWNRVGEGKELQLDAARRVAVWLDATDEDLIAPGLEYRLKARLPKLLEDFKAAMESLGFVW